MASCRGRTHLRQSRGADHARRQERELIGRMPNTVVSIIPHRTVAIIPAKQLPDLRGLQRWHRAMWSITKSSGA